MRRPKLIAQTTKTRETKSEQHQKNMKKETTKNKIKRR